MRTFIAIDIPGDIKRAVGDYTEVLSGIVDGVKWVSPDNLHLTMKFLGEVSEDRLDAVKQCVGNVAGGCSPFMVELAHMGVFPDPHEPRVIWIGVDNGLDQLLEMYQDLEDCLESIGLDRDEKTFSPHLTIGRVKRHTRIGLPTGIPEFDEVSFEADRLSVIRSTLTPSGPIYETLHESAFPQYSYHE